MTASIFSVFPTANPSLKCRSCAAEYLICMTARSGSTVLCRFLHETGMLGNPNEFFNPRGPAQRFKQSLAAESLIEFTNKLKDRFSTPNDIFGVKICWLDFQPLVKAGLVESLFDSPRIFYLDRRDQMLQAISSYRAKRSGIWQVKRGEDKARPPLAFDARAIKAEYDYLSYEKASWQHYFASKEIIPHRLFYEDLLADLSPSLNAIAKELCVTLTGRMSWDNAAYEKLGLEEDHAWAERCRKLWSSA